MEIKRQGRGLAARCASCFLLAGLLVACSSSADTGRPDKDGQPDVFESGAVRLTRVVTAGDLNGPGLICRVREPGGIALLPDGGLVVQSCDCAKVLIFDPNGNYQGTVGPGCGEGPGELTRFLSVASTSTGDVLVSGLPGRLLRYDPADGNLQEQVQVPFNAVVLAVLPDGDRLLKYIDPGENFARGLHIHDVATGRRQTSFHTVQISGPRSLWVSRLTQFQTVVDEQGHIWVVRAENEYEIEEWDGSGNLVREFVNSPSWFRSYPEQATAARPRIAAAAWSGGLLWVIAQTPLEWRDDPEMPTERTFATTQEAYDAALAAAPETQWVVAAVEPTTGKIIAEGQFRPELHNLRMVSGTNGGFYRTDIDDDGNVRVSLFKPEVVSTNPKSSAE